MKAIKNGKVILKDKVLEGKVIVFDSKIIDICDEVPDNCEDVIDAKGKYVSPGLIDIHIHGNSGHDVMYGRKEDLKVISKSVCSSGVTSYLATTMTMSKEIIYKALDNIRDYLKNGNKEGARIIGTHLEGPFINEDYCGAQDPEHIIVPSFDFVKDYVDIIKVITYAPEKDKDMEFTKYINENTDIILSLGHTNATYDKAIEAIDLGAKHITHLFNAMTGLNHRNPGVVGAALNSNVKCELIADTIHVRKDLFEMLVKLKRKSDLLLVTDAIEATNLPDGTYSLGGQPVEVKCGCARIKSTGSLAGSTARLNNMVKNFKENTSLEIYEAINLASLNPAMSLGVDDRKGSLEVGKDADIVIFDNNMKCELTIVEGSVEYKLD